MFFTSTYSLLNVDGHESEGSSSSSSSDDDEDDLTTTTTVTTTTTTVTEDPITGAKTTTTTTVEKKTEKHAHHTSHHHHHHHRHWKQVLPKTKLLEDHPWFHIAVWPHIETGYRIPNGSFWDCGKTLFTLHNEFMNAWTHIIGGIWFIYLLIQCIRLLNNPMGLFVHILHCVSAIAVCTASASYHTFCCHSENICKIVQCLDWTMISSLIFTSNLVTSYYELIDFPNIFYGFLTTNIILMLTTSWITYSSLKSMFGMKSNESEKIQKTEEQAKPSVFSSILASYQFRTLVYMFYGHGPLLAWIANYLLKGEISDTIEGIIMMYASYLTVILCLFHWPERLVSNHMFDIFVSYCYLDVLLNVMSNTFLFLFLGWFASDFSYWYCAWSNGIVEYLF